MKTTITCTVCPNGCRVDLEGDGKIISSIRGFRCPRGEEFAKNEYLHPVRILTSTVKVEGSDVPLVPVRTTRPIPKELQLSCMKVLKRTVIQAPVHRHDVIIRNLLDTGADLVATGDAK